MNPNSPRQQLELKLLVDINQKASKPAEDRTTVLPAMAGTTPPATSERCSREATGADMLIYEAIYANYMKSVG